MWMWWKLAENERTIHVTVGRALAKERPFFVSLSWLEWAEFCAIIDKNNCLILHMYDHVESAIPIHIAEFAGYRDQAAAVAKQGRASVDHGVGCIATGKLDDDDMAVQVHKDKV